MNHACPSISTCTSIIPSISMSVCLISPSRVLIRSISLQSIFLNFGHFFYRYDRLRYGEGGHPPTGEESRGTQQRLARQCPRCCHSTVSTTARPLPPYCYHNTMSTTSSPLALTLILLSQLQTGWSLNQGPHKWAL